MRPLEYITGRRIRQAKVYLRENTKNIKEIALDVGYTDAGYFSAVDGNGAAREADNNKRSGLYSLKFWDDVPVKFTAEQTISGIPAGTYELGAYLQGGSAGSFLLSS